MCPPQRRWKKCENGGYESIRPGFFWCEKTGEAIRGPRGGGGGGGSGRSALKDAKIVRFHRHDLRPTFASRLRQKSAKLEDLEAALGHMFLMMSKPYARLGLAGLHDVVTLLQQNRLDPN